MLSRLIERYALTFAFLLPCLGATVVVAQISDGGSGYSAPRGGSFQDTPVFEDSLEVRTTTAVLDEGRISFIPQDIPLWEPATAYVVGDRRFLRVSGAGDVSEYVDYGATQGWTFSYLVMRCTVAGTSHATTPPTFGGTYGTTATDGTVTWTFDTPQRRIFEIYGPGTGDRTGDGASGPRPLSWFRANGSYASFRGMSLGGTSNGKTGKEYDLFDPFLPGGTAGWGQWIGITLDGNNQQAISINTRQDIGMTNVLPFLLGDGYPSLTTTDNAALFKFAIDHRGGLNWTGTYATPPGGSGGSRLGHVQNSTATDSDTGWALRLWPDATGRTIVQGVGTGAAPGNVNTNCRGIYQKLAMTDNTATDIARVTLPNVEISATVTFTILSRASDGESTESHTGVISFNRKAAGSNVVGIVGTLASGPAEAADGAQPITTAVTLQDNGEAAGAVQTFDIQVTINTNNSATAECTFLFDFINHQTGGAIITPL